MLRKRSMFRLEVESYQFFAAFLAASTVTCYSSKRSRCSQRRPFEKRCILETTTVSTDFVSLILHASPLAKAVLVILLVFSAISWGVIASKFAQLRRASAETVAFLDVF